MPPKALTIQTPGETPATPTEETQPTPAGTDDGSAARIAELEAIVAQQNAMISQLMAQAQSVATVPVVAKEAGEPRIVGEDWRSKTTAEAHAAGVTITVLCSDGYYVPG